MPLTLFNHVATTISRARVDSTGEHVGRFFTDPNARRIGNSDCELLFLLETKCAFGDLPGLPSQLPLIYKMRDSDFYPFAYRLCPNGKVKILSRFWRLRLPSAIFHSSSRDRSAQPIPYDATNADDALAWAGVFSLDALAKSEMERAISIVDGRWGSEWSNWGNHCIVPIEYHDSKEDVLRTEIVSPFTQKKCYSCPDPDSKCDELTSFGAAKAIALYEGDDDLNLFGDFDLQLIFVYCTRCHCIGVENQCR
jgi:hypothetical protein